MAIQISTGKLVCGKLSKRMNESVIEIEKRERENMRWRAREAVVKLHTSVR